MADKNTRRLSEHVTRTRGTLNGAAARVDVLESRGLVRLAVAWGVDSGDPLWRTLATIDRRQAEALAETLTAALEADADERPDVPTMCDHCGATLERENCPNYGDGEVHA